MLDWIKSKTNKNRKDSGTFNFHLKSQPQFIDSSTTLTLTAYSNLLQNATIPCVYRWTVIRNGLRTERPEFRGCSFRCEPGDVGTIIEAEVISTDYDYNGTAIVHFGPVRLDLKLRKHIQMALSTGGTVVSANLVQGFEERQCQISLSEDIIKISHVYSDANFTFDYGVSEPKIQCSFKDQNRLLIYIGSKHVNSLGTLKSKLFSSPATNLNGSFQSTNDNRSQNLENCLSVKFPNHLMRDSFIFIWKGLMMKKQFRVSMIVQRLQNLDLTKNQTLDFMMEVEGLKAYINKLDHALKRANSQNQHQSRQIKNLKHQIQSVVMTYTQALGQSSRHSMNLSHASSFVSEKQKYKHLYLENNHINSRINALTSEIDSIRFQPKISCPERQSNVPISVKSPFSKKKIQDDSQDFISLLQDLSSSRVTEISQIAFVREDPTLRMRLQKAERDNEHLQSKLQMSFNQIQNLQKQLQMNRSNIHAQTLNMSRKMIQTGNNHSLHNISVNFKSVNQPKNDSFMSIKTQKKGPMFMEHQDKELLGLVVKKSNQITAMKQQIERLQKQNAELQSKLEQIKDKNSAKYQTIISSLREQTQVYSRNSSVINRSQESNCSMTAFKDEQFQTIKNHNNVLTNQNAKLSRACEKYMNEARECTKLRMQVIKLRGKISQDKLY